MKCLCVAMMVGLRSWMGVCGYSVAAYCGFLSRGGAARIDDFNGNYFGVRSEQITVLDTLEYLGFRCVLIAN